MPARRSSLCAIFAVSVALLLSLPLLAKNFAKPVAQPAINYPAHDFHRDEKVAFAADPYDTPQKAEIFPKELIEGGFLPIFFIATNDNDQPISIANIEIILTTRDGDKLTPITMEDVYRRLSNPQGRTRPPAVPIPLPHKKPKGTLSQKQMDELAAAQFAARAVEPHNTQSGFLFFDIGGISSPLADANIDITGVADAKGQELLYFELPMQKYLNAPPKP
jgi:hypothetical protein